MERGECPYPRRRGESLSDGERRMSLSEDERGVSLSQEKRRFPNHLCTARPNDRNTITVRGIHFCPHFWLATAEAHCTHYKTTAEICVKRTNVAQNLGSLDLVSHNATRRLWPGMAQKQPVACFRRGTGAGLEGPLKGHPWFRWWWCWRWCWCFSCRKIDGQQHKEQEPEKSGPPRRGQKGVCQIEGWEVLRCPLPVRKLVQSNPSAHKS